MNSRKIAIGSCCLSRQPKDIALAEGRVNLQAIKEEW